MKSSREQITSLTTEIITAKGKMDTQDILANMLGIMSSSYQEANDRHNRILSELQTIRTQIDSLKMIEKQIEEVEKRTTKLENKQLYHSIVISVLVMIGGLSLAYLFQFGFEQVFERPILSSGQESITEKP